MNGDKTLALTNETQHPSHLWTHTGIKLQAVWWSEMAWMHPHCPEGWKDDFNLNHHMQAVSKSSFGNKTILCDRNVPVNERLRYLDAVVSLVVALGSGHRTVHQKVHQLDVACRKFLRAVVRSLLDFDWSRLWHEILHDCNGKVESSRACTPKQWRAQVGTGVKKKKIILICTRNFRSTPAKVDEVVQMRFPQLLVFSSVHPMSKIFVSTVWSQFMIPTVWRTSGIAGTRRRPS